MLAARYGQPAQPTLHVVVEIIWVALFCAVRTTSRSYCMYYDQELNITMAGNCMLTFGIISPTYYFMVSIPNAASINLAMCTLVRAGSQHREGRFCGRCVAGHGLAVYSYHYITCIPCANYGYKSWLRYFAVALLPLTVFYLLVVLLQVNVAASRFNGLVLIIQCICSPIQMRMVDSLASSHVGTTPPYLKGLNVFLSAIGIANLDFFRSAYPSFCLHPQFNILHVTSLDFVVALYHICDVSIGYHV